MESEYIGNGKKYKQLTAEERGKYRGISLAELFDFEDRRLYNTFKIND